MGYKKSNPSPAARQALINGAARYDTRKYLGHTSKKKPKNGSKKN
tara:strand:- start:3213 stop:3347 length:135 start_codon:yes stop_codon:yes gene_type:complete